MLFWWILNSFNAESQDRSPGLNFFLNRLLGQTGLMCSFLYCQAPSQAGREAGDTSQHLGLVMNKGCGGQSQIMSKNSWETARCRHRKTNKVKDARKMPEPMKSSNFKWLTTFQWNIYPKEGKSFQIYHYNPQKKSRTKSSSWSHGGKHRWK